MGIHASGPIPAWVALAVASGPPHEVPTFQVPPVGALKFHVLTATRQNIIIILIPARRHDLSHGNSDMDIVTRHVTYTFGWPSPLSAVRSWAWRATRSAGHRDSGNSRYRMKTALSYAELAPNRRLRWSGLIDGWRLIALGAACAVALPVLVVLASLLAPAGEIWAHLASTVLQSYLRNTLALALGVGCGVLAIGVGTAWLVSMCIFPGRRLFEWALLLPLAVPAYIIGYTYTDLLEYAGPVQGLLREATGWTHADYWFPPIRSLGGAIVVMSLVLYPYVYLLARAAFLEQCTCMLDVSRTLGRGPGAASSDRGAAGPAGDRGRRRARAHGDPRRLRHRAVLRRRHLHDRHLPHLVRAGAPTAAAQLAGVLMLVVLLVLTLERASRGLAKYQHTAQSRQRSTYRLSGPRSLLASCACALPVALGFAVPVLVLLDMSCAGAMPCSAACSSSSPRTASPSRRSPPS